MLKALRMRPGFSLLLWPFLLLPVVFAFDSPIKNPWDGLLRVSFAFSILGYPLAYFYGLILSRSKDETRVSRARFWLTMPWKVILFWGAILIVLWCIQIL
jgi:hypothetical protein